LPDHRLGRPGAGRHGVQRLRPADDDVLLRRARAPARRVAGVLRPPAHAVRGPAGPLRPPPGCDVPPPWPRPRAGRELVPPCRGRTVHATSWVRAYELVRSGAWVELARFVPLPCPWPRTR